MTPDVILLGILGVIVFVVVFRDAIDRPSPGDADTFTGKSEAVKVTLKRLAEAKQFMESQGVKTLLKGRPAYQKVNPMHAPTEPEKVVAIRKAKR